MRTGEAEDAAYRSAAVRIDAAKGEGLLA